MSQKLFIEKTRDIQINAKIGEKPDLPEKVLVKYSNGIKDKLSVEWESIEPSHIEQQNTFTITGELKPLRYPNPLIEQRADPFIYKHIDGYYYFTASVPEYDRIILRKAKTISELGTAEEKTIWKSHTSGEMARHIWAPEIHFIDGNWFIYFAAGHSDDKWAIRQYVLKNSSKNPLADNWQEKGKIKMNFESFTLDATTFTHRQNRYLVWAQKKGGNSNLYIAEMENPWTISGPQVKIAGPKYNWETAGFPVNEGPAVIKKGGQIFITYSASATDHHYCMGLLSAETDANLLETNSWHKKSEPVFTSNERTKEYGPGHNSFTVAEDETTDLLVYHSRSYKEIEGNPLYDPNRHTRVQKLFWTDKKEPYFAFPGYTIEGNKKVTATIKII